MSLYLRYPASGSGGGSGSGVTVYTNLAAFPASASNGTLAVAGDTNILYEYSTSAVAWQPIASNASYTGGGSAITALTGDVTATGPGSVASTVAKIAGVAVGTPTGTGNVVFSSSPTLITPALGTPSALVGTNITGTAAGLTAGTVTTNANLTGNVTSVGNATTIASGVVTNTMLAGSITAAKLVGSDIATVGTITTGTWTGTTLAIANGGTGQITAAAAFNSLSPITTTGDLIYSPAGATSQRLAIGSTGNVLTVVAGAPAWAPPATSGTVTSVSVTTANGVSGTVATASTTPAITLTLGSITPSAINVSGLTASSAVATDGSKNLVSVTNTGSGSNVLATSPTLVTPVLGTPSSGTLTSCTGLPLTTGVTGILPVANGGTNSSSVVSAPAATAWAGWDANSNLSANNHIEGFRTQATANSTLTLVVGDAFQQFFTGTTAGQIVKLPTTSIVAGMSYLIANNSTQSVAVQSSGANAIQTLAANTQGLFTALVATPTTAANWNFTYGSTGAVAAVNPTIQTFTSGSGTYTTPAGVQWISVEMIGGGGGGGGSGGSGSPGNGGTGGNTTFSTYTAGGGGGGALGSGATGSGAGGAPGSNSGSPQVSIVGAAGQSSVYTAAALATESGGQGGSGYFGGAGAGGSAPSISSTGGAGATNSGGGGGGAGGDSTATHGGGGGASGNYAQQIISSPAATYSYSYGVGAGGAAGSAGATGAGGVGGSGYIKVTEFYNALAVGTTAAVSANLVMAGPSSGSAAAPTFRALALADMPAGSVVQVVSTTKADTFTTTSGSYTDITGMSVSITPRSASNKILVLVSLQGSQAVSTGRAVFQLVRASTAIAVGNVVGSRSQASGQFAAAANSLATSLSINYLDSPATTSSTTYKVQAWVSAGSGAITINQDNVYGNSADEVTMASTITVMEIQG